MAFVFASSLILMSCGGNDKKDDTKDDTKKTEEVSESPYKLVLDDKKNTYKPGSELYFNFVADPNWDKKAWIGVVPSETPHGTEATNDENDISYQYIEGRKEGLKVLYAPMQPGKYDLRMNDSDDPAKGKEIFSVSFEVK